MRIIHCADLHLDSPLTRHLDDQIANKRRSEILHNFERLADYASREGIDTILIAGDLFDAGRVRASALDTVQYVITSHPNIHFYYLQGNHDGAGLFGETRKPGNLFLFGDCWTEYILGDTGCVHLYGIEPTRANCDIAASSLVPDVRNVNIVMLHGQVINAGSDAEADPDRIPIYAYRNKGIDYVALGHIHKYREEALDSRGVYCYCGALEGRGFDETGEHGFVVLDIDETNHTIKRDFVAFAQREVHEINVDITGLTEIGDLFGRIDAALTSCRAEDLVRVVLVGSLDLAMSIDTAYIESRYSERFYVFSLKLKTCVRISAELYLKDASLRGEFVRLVMARADLTQERKGEIVRIGLRALEGDGKI